MTANLTFPADVWACKQPGVPFVAAIVEGECSGHCGPRRDCCEVPNDPPAWLVALRDARCETCGGRGRVKGMHHGAADLQFPCPNERCVDGRLLHDVRVETLCDKPHNSASMCCSHAYEGGECCWCEQSYRTVRCLVDVVPVVSGNESCPGEGHHVVVYDHGPVNVCQGPPEYDYEPTTPTHVDALAAACGKPPADWVGMYAVILTTTDQEAE